MAQITEALMLICFGISWPVSVYKSWTSKKTGGKSLLFLLLIDAGYIIGLIGKIIYNYNWVVIVYCANALFVTTDVILYFRNKSIERKLKTAE